MRYFQANGNAFDSNTTSIVQTSKKFKAYGGFTIKAVNPIILKMLFTVNLNALFAQLKAYVYSSLYSWEKT